MTMQQLLQLLLQSRLLLLLLSFHVLLRRPFDAPALALACHLLFQSNFRLPELPIQRFFLSPLLLLQHLRAS